MSCKLQAENGCCTRDRNGFDWKKGWTGRPLADLFPFQVFGCFISYFKAGQWDLAAEHAAIPLTDPRPCEAACEVRIYAFVRRITVWLYAPDDFVSLLGLLVYCRILWNETSFLAYPLYIFFVDEPEQQVFVSCLILFILVFYQPQLYFYERKLGLFY